VEGVIAGFTMSGLGTGGNAGKVTIIWESASGATVNVVFDAVGYTR
jgi:hypothetical protein